jgi:hypothetical protein
MKALDRRSDATPERWAHLPLANAKQIGDLRKRFEGYTGPVVNTGGVR